MLRPLFRLGLTAAIVLASLAVAVAQDREKDPDDYRRFFRKPETVAEYWKALQFELDVGRPDLAARHLHGLLELKPTDNQLLSLIDSIGLTPILRLRSIRTWSSDRKEQAQAEKDVKTLLDRAVAAARKRQADPERIRGLIAQLGATPEERAYAVAELRKTGAPAVPYLIEALERARGAANRLLLLQTLRQMGSDAIAPMLAALDSDNSRLKLDLLDQLRLRVRYAEQIVPHLWFLSASKDESPSVRKEATALLADFLDLPASRLTPARVALTREAERYYQHQVSFGDPRNVVVWRWDGKRVVQGWPGAATITAPQAEEYWGLRYARQALRLDPTYRPAQLVFLSLAVDQASRRSGLGANLARTEPEVADLLARASTDLLIEMLDRALKEERTGVVLPVTRTLGDRAEVRAKRPSGRGDPPLVRALYYPDPRVQLSAAESLLLIPGKPAPRTAARIVDVLARLLSPAAAALPGSKVIVAIFEEDWRNKVRVAVTAAGFEPIPVGNGRDLMREVRARADVDAVLLESTLPFPGLAPLLAQLRADVDVGRVPVLLAAVPQTPVSKQVSARYRDVDRRLQGLEFETRAYRAALSDLQREEAEHVREIEKTRGLSKDEQLSALRTNEEKYGQLRKMLDQDYLMAVRLSRDIPKLEAEKGRLAQRYDAESQVRENQLERYTARYPGIRVVHAGVLSDTRSLESTLTAAIRGGGVALTAAQRARNAEIAMQILSKLAQGQPPGYDVRPATGAILDALRTGRLSPRGQVAAVDAAARLPGSRAQAELLNVILDSGRNGDVRTAAAEGLVQSVQRHGVLLTAAQVAPLRELARQAKLPAGLKTQLSVLIGALRPDARATGDRLLRYNPKPVAPMPPPK